MREIGGHTSWTNILSAKFKNCGSRVLKTHGHAMQESGWPDQYVAHCRWSGWLELKIDGTPLQTNQRLCIEDLRNRNVNAWVLRFYNATSMVDIQNEAGDTFFSFKWYPEITGMQILTHLSEVI